MIPYGKQDINDEDIQAVIDVLKSDFLTQGPSVQKFEKSISDYTTSKFAIALNSATSALHLACLSLGLKKGDIVWTTPITFVASANCALYCEAKVDFVDIDPKTYNLSVSALEEKLKEAKKSNALPKIVIPVHLAGQPCDMVKISELSKAYGFSIIEDASHAIGGRYKNKPVGNCEYSDITVFSLHPVKIITTGEGGVITTNNPALYEKIMLLRSHGITRDPNLMTEKSHGPWYYQQLELGYNYRLTDIQAALGTSQMKRIDHFIKKRHQLANHYFEKLKDIKALELPYQSPDSHSAFHLFIVRIKPEYTKKSHLQVFEELREQGIGVNLHYIPVYQQPYYRKLGFKKDLCKNAEEYYQSAISIPMYSGLSNTDQEKVIDSLRKTFI